MIIDFLETKQLKENLKIALEVLREFKQCESEKEWFWITSRRALHYSRILSRH